MTKDRMSSVIPGGEPNGKEGRPLYTVVRDRVHASIDAGRYGPGERLPSTKALSQELEVSLVTVHRAMQELVGSGVLRRGQGRGTFVHEGYGREGRQGLACRVGLVFHAESSVADAYHGQIFEGVRRRAHEIGMDLVLLRFGEDWRNECQGYIYVNPFDEQLAKPPRGGRRAMPPIMVVGATFPDHRVHSVDTDNVALARRAVEHLASLGHRRVAFVGAQGQVSNDRDRVRGFLEACAVAGLPVDPAHVLRNAGWRLDDAGRAALERVLTGDRPPTALFAAGYHFALDAYTTAQAAGLSIPSDLSVIGVDDPPSASHLSPPLTTFRQPLVEIGRLAADGLVRVISGERGAAPLQVAVSAEFVERASCGPVPAGAGASQRTGATAARPQGKRLCIGTTETAV